jgi:hypothetical protein
MAQTAMADSKCRGRQRSAESESAILSATLLQRGVARGEIRDGLDADLVLDLVYGPTIFRFMVGHGPLNDLEAEGMIAALFAGIEARPAQFGERAQCQEPNQLAHAKACRLDNR